MMKYLLALLAVVVGIVLIKRHWRSHDDRATSLKRDEAARPLSNAKPAQVMLACAHCGTYVPSDVAVTREARSYCSQAHAERGPHA